MSLVSQNRSSPPDLGPFATNLAAARRASGHTQESLGFAADLHRTEVSLIERRGREPRLGTLLRWASSTGTSLDQLCAGLRWIPTREESGLIFPGRWDTGTPER